MDHQSRRSFIRTSALTLATVSAAPVLASGTAPGPSGRKPGMKIPFELGIASYTFRKFSLEDTLEMTTRLDMKHIAFKSFHLPLDADDELIDQTVKKVKAAGINLYGAGVVYMRDEDQVNNAFEYARKAGMDTIIGVPGHELLPLVEKKVKEYGIRVAIHNHGPGDELYPTAGSIVEKVGDLDPRIGICLDIGHQVRFGADLFGETKKYADRLLDVHIKDETEATAEGKTVEIGRGVIDVASYLELLVGLGYPHKVSFEFEKDQMDPLPGLAESVGYVRGVLDMIQKS